MSALGGAVSGGLGFGADKLLGSIGKVSSTLRSIAQPAVRGAEAALSEAATQGMAYLTHQREGWSWRDVASAALTAGGGASVGDVVGQTANWGMDKVFGEAESKGWKVVREVTAKTLSGAASRVTTTLARGGTVEPGYIAADAFGNALGSALGGTGAGYAQEDMARKRLEEQAAAIAAVERQGPERFHLVPPEDLRLKLDLEVGGLRNYSMAARAAVDGEIGVPGNGEGQLAEAVASIAGETPSANGAKPAGGLLSTAASMLDEMALSAVQAKDAARKQQAVCLGDSKQCQAMYEQLRALKQLVPTLQGNLVVSNGSDMLYAPPGVDFRRDVQPIHPEQLPVGFVVDVDEPGGDLYQLTSRALNEAVSYFSSLKNSFDPSRLQEIMAEAVLAGPVGLVTGPSGCLGGTSDFPYPPVSQEILGLSDKQFIATMRAAEDFKDFESRVFLAGAALSTGTQTALDLGAAMLEPAMLERTMLGEVGGGGAVQSNSPAAVYRTVEESPRMVVQELEYSCGAACARQLLADEGLAVSESALRRVGFEPGRECSLRR